MDITFLLFLQKFRESCGGIFDNLMLKTTTLGEGTTTFLLLAFVYWCIDKHSGQLMALNVSVACTWNQFLKKIFKVERPWVKDERIIPVQAAVADAGGYSFPSGHTTRATATWGGLGATLWKKKEKAVSNICWGVLVLIAFSRNYLGVHTPQDVFVALIVGVILIFAWDRILDWVDRDINRGILVSCIGCLLCFLPMLKAGCLSNAGAGMGLLIGWGLERHFVNFEINGNCWKKCVRFAGGAAGIIFIMTVLRAALGLAMEPKYAGFFSGFVLTVFIMFLYPICFSKIGGRRFFFLLAVVAVAGSILLSLLQ